MHQGRQRAKRCLTCSHSRVEKRFDFGGEGGHLLRLRGEAAVLKERAGLGASGEQLCLGVDQQPDLYCLQVVKIYSNPFPTTNSPRNERYETLTSAACVGEEGHPLAVQSAFPRRNILYRR